jgi:hypothetical protein
MGVHSESNWAWAAAVNTTIVACGVGSFDGPTQRRPLFCPGGRGILCANLAVVLTVVSCGLDPPGCICHHLFKLWFVLGADPEGSKRSRSTGSLLLWLVNQMPAVPQPMVHTVAFTTYLRR